MTELTLDQAQAMIAGAFRHAAEKGYEPLGVAVLDARASLKAYAAQDGTSLFRFRIAFAKANGALGMGFGSAELERRVRERPYFLGAVNALVDGGVVPAPGGVLVRDASGRILGAVGISGDRAHNDEHCAVAGIEAAGFRADPG